MVVSYGIDSNSNCASLESFRSNRPKPEVKTPPVSVETAPIEPDKVEVSAQAEQPKTQVEDAPTPKEKKVSLVQRFKNCVAGMKKFFISSWEYTKGTAKGLFYGAVAAAGVLGADAVIGLAKNYNQMTNVVENVAPEAMGTAKKTAKLLSKKGKFFAGLAAVATFGYQLFKASLNVSEKSAAVDHRWGSGHNKVD